MTLFIQVLAHLRQAFSQSGKFLLIYYFFGLLPIITIILASEKLYNLVRVCVHYGSTASSFLSNYILQMFLILTLKLNFWSFEVNKFQQKIPIFTFWVLRSCVSAFQTALYIFLHSFRMVNFAEKIMIFFFANVLAPPSHPPTKIQGYVKINISCTVT